MFDSSAKPSQEGPPWSAPHAVGRIPPAERESMSVIMPFLVNLVEETGSTAVD